ncbi:hypothetical protein EMGBS15_03430 [Filimonas sp.]|nr:hypothetical protein EMGBS15_03430 [Filimonas sp.]
MKQNNHLLDDYLQQKVEDANFSMTEAYWQKMSVLLDEEEKKKKRFFFWRGLSVLALLLLTGAGAYLLPKLSHNEAKETMQHQPLSKGEETILPSAKQDLPVTANETEAIPMNENNQPSTNNINSSTNNPNPSVIHKKTSIDQNNTSTSAAFQEDTQQPLAAKQTENSSVSKSDLKTTGQKPLAELSTRAQQRLQRKSKHQKIQDDVSMTDTKTNGDKVKPYLSEESANESIAMVKPATHKLTNSPKEKVDRNTRKRNKMNVLPAANAASKPTDAVAQSNPVPQGNVPVSARLMKPVDTVQYVRRQPIDQSIYNPRYIGSLADYIPERLDSVTVITYQPVPEVKPLDVKSSDAKQGTEPAKAKFRRPFELILLAGLNMNKGFKGNVSDPVSWAFSPYAGVGADKPLSSKLTLSSHVGFTYFNGLNSEIKVNSFQYGFGLDSSAFAVAHQKLLQFYLPFSVYYELFKNHFVMASLGVSYSFDVSSKVTQTKMTNNVGYNGGTTKAASSTTTTQSGYRNGFNQFDVFAQLGYSYRFADRFMLQCMVQQGFSI